MDDLDTLRICALLHDIGKPESWAHFGDDVWRKLGAYHSHVRFGQDVISECLGEKGETIALVARHHHKSRSPKFREDWPVEDFEQIVHKADYLASSADRPRERGRGRSHVQLAHPISHIDAPVFLVPEQDSRMLFGISNQIRDILQSVATLIGVDNKKAYDELYRRLSDSGMTRIPADTTPYKNDHTLWDHSKLTTAFATCIYLDGGYTGKSDRYNDYQFAFLGGDTDRVGEFIHQSRRLPDLVARSNIASRAVKNAVKAIKDALGPECIIYNGGGNFLVLSPLSKADVLRDIAQREFDKETERRLSITIDYCKVNGGEIALLPFRPVSEEAGFNAVWRRVFGIVRAKKRVKGPRYPSDTNIEGELCDVCLEEPGTIEDPRHPYWIVEDGVRRRERLCVRCHSLRHKEWLNGVFLEKYADKETGLVALFKIDGDDVGDVIEGSMLEDKCKKVASPARLSFASRLIDCACRELGRTLEENYDGKCIYAEGDDLLGVVRGSQGLRFVKESVDFFCKQMAGNVTMSAGVVIMKAHFPVYMALEALEQLLQNAKDYRERSDFYKTVKANVDFEVIDNVGLTKDDLGLQRRMERRERHLSHRPCKIQDMNEFFRMLGLIESSNIRKGQASILATALASRQGADSGIPEENMKHARMIAKNLIGRGYVDLKRGEFLLRSIDNGVICDAYVLATRVYRKEGITGD